MTAEQTPTKHEEQKRKVVYQRSASEAVYGFGFIGACIFYFTHATSFWIGVLGFFKALVWPAILVFEALKYLN